MIKEKINKSTFKEAEMRTEYQIIKGRKVKVRDYLVCDYCGIEINMSVPKTERIGGIIKLPWILTGQDKDIKIACCNSCVNKVLGEFN